MIDGIMSHWYMMQKLYIQGTGGDDSAVQPVDEWTNLHFIRAFEWNDVSLSSTGNMTFRWNQIEYFVIKDAASMTHLFLDISTPLPLKYLSLSWSGIEEISELFCLQNQLVVFHLYMESMLSIPHCISDIKSLKALWIESCVYLVDFPLSIFSLPNLIELSLHQSNIEYQDLITYNIPEDMQNDTQGVELWFDDNFRFNIERTDYWFQSPICDSNYSELPSGLANFVNVTCSAYNPCMADGVIDLTEQYCPTRVLGKQTQFLIFFHFQVISTGPVSFCPQLPR